jgi:hypothetical protein
LLTPVSCRCCTAAAAAVAQPSANIRYISGGSTNIEGRKTF